MKAYLIGGTAGAIIALVFGLYSLKYPLGTFKEPGDGLVPLLVSSLLLVCSLGLLLSGWFSRSKALGGGETEEPTTPLRAYVVFTALGVCALTLDLVGYIPSMTVLMFVVLRAMHFRTWRVQAVTAVLASVGSYLLFDKTLGLLLPMGIFSR